MNTDKELIENIKSCICQKKYSEGEQKALKAISQQPNSPIAHNLMGIILEKEHRHVQAIKYFKFAYALDPTYIPARANMKQYGIFFPMNDPAYSEEECTVKFACKPEKICNREG